MIWIAVEKSLNRIIHKSQVKPPKSHWAESRINKRNDRLRKEILNECELMDYDESEIDILEITQEEYQQRLESDPQYKIEQEKEFERGTIEARARKEGFDDALEALKREGKTFKHH